MNMIFSKALTLAIPLLLASILGVHATPGSGIVISDEIIGTTQKSFFVIRTTILRPPTYYQFRERIEFVELSIPEGNVQQRCTMRETDNQSDPSAEKEAWRRTEMKTANCRAFDILSRRKANYIEPRRLEASVYSFRLGADGIAVKATASDESTKWIGVLSAKETKRRAAAVAVISTSVVPWNTHQPSQTMLSLLGLERDDQPLHEACELESAAATSRNTSWAFLRFLCWSGDDDVDGANFYIPIDSRAWLKDTN